MRKCALVLLFLLLCTVLNGCSQASQVENHAYVLVMGLDKTQDGQIKITVQIPKISGGASEEAGTGKEGDNYMQFAVTAHSYEAGLEKLDWASPRDLTLSQIKLIVLSRELAESDECRALIKSIAQTERLYTASKVTVCKGRAEDFVAAIQPKIGTRISTDIEAMFEHYNSRGYVPGSSLADLFYQTESIYSDPMVTFAMLEKQQDAQTGESQSMQSASALSGYVQSISASYESEIPTRFLGAAVFADGHMKGVFTGTQSIISGLLRNEVESTRYECGGQNLIIVPTSPVYVSVDVQNDPAIIKIDAKLALAAQEELPDEEKLRESFEKDIRSTIQAAREFGAEPFGFGEKAARNFLTIDDWRKYNWDQKFIDAKIEIELSFVRSDA